MKIDRLRAFMSRDNDRPCLIVAIDTDDGITGWGEWYNHGPDKALLPCWTISSPSSRGTIRAGWNA
ncbi:MAG: hypothetical protein FJX35_22600 [Alphaproteobacteria bacterium]|nr:hypothetical protein [Alphaproteobacteria bacterium]